MKYIAIDEHLAKILSQMDTELSKVEVKGDSVNSLWIGRMLVRQIFEPDNQKTFDEIVKLEEKEKGEKEKGK